MGLYYTYKLSKLISSFSIFLIMIINDNHFISFNSPHQDNVYIGLGSKLESVFFIICDL